MKKGYVAMVLHSHLPFVRHPETIDALEERWLFEAMSECYIPLIEIYDNLIKDGIDFNITMSITPPLMAMLEDEYLSNKYIEYLNKAIQLADMELKKNKNMNAALFENALFYFERFNRFLNIYKSYDCNLMNAFRKFYKAGKVEIITCSATHGLLPLLMINPETVKAQLATAVQSYIDGIGSAPKGIWLPECAYTYSLDSMLKEFGLKYFISESKAILDASPRPRYGTYTPISLTNGVCTFGRDMESGQQVWSSYMGYPGDPDYREFYRDIGYEIPEEDVKEYVNKAGIRLDTGIKYYRVTGKTDNKQYYNRTAAMERVNQHAMHFAKSRNNVINSISSQMDVPPIITCPYDTELYGHWWFEGPDFIDKFIRISSEEWISYELTTPSKYLEANPVVQCSSPCPSSWGENSDYSVWLNPSNHWIYKDIHECAEKMIRLANTYSEPSELQRRALNQAARELMLAESSDWPFIIKHNTTVDYAIRRVNTHVDRFNRLYEAITKNSIDSKVLSQIEGMDNIFPEINYKIYKRISNY
jgi:1,4-alpha-glucan branching enzyme